MGCQTSKQSNNLNKYQVDRIGHKNDKKNKEKINLTLTRVSSNNIQTFQKIDLTPNNLLKKDVVSLTEMKNFKSDKLLIQRKSTNGVLYGKSNQCLEKSNKNNQSCENQKQIRRQKKSSIQSNINENMLINENKQNQQKNKIMEKLTIYEDDDEQQQQIIKKQMLLNKIKQINQQYQSDPSQLEYNYLPQKDILEINEAMQYLAGTNSDINPDYKEIFSNYSNKQVILNLNINKLRRNRIVSKKKL